MATESVKADRLAQLMKMHQAEPGDAFCTYGIALEHAKAGRREEALGWLDKTLGIDGAYCYAYFQKGKILGELGREEEARAVLQKGIEAGRKSGTPDNLHAAEEMTGLMESL